eukprot:SAG11_NODE_2061_length_3871_cov_6.900583_1_plen_131_part_00
MQSTLPKIQPIGKKVQKVPIKKCHTPAVGVPGRAVQDRYCPARLQIGRYSRLGDTRVCDTKKYLGTKKKKYLGTCTCTQYLEPPSKFRTNCVCDTQIIIEIPDRCAIMGGQPDAASINTSQSGRLAQIRP